MKISKYKSEKNPFIFLILKPLSEETPGLLNIHFQIQAVCTIAGMYFFLKLVTQGHFAGFIWMHLQQITL